MRARARRPDARTARAGRGSPDRTRVPRRPYRRPEVSTTSLRSMLRIADTRTGRLVEIPSGHRHLLRICVHLPVIDTRIGSEHLRAPLRRRRTGAHRRAARPADPHGPHHPDLPQEQVQALDRAMAALGVHPARHRRCSRTDRDAGAPADVHVLAHGTPRTTPSTGSGSTWARSARHPRTRAAQVPGRAAPEGRSAGCAGCCCSATPTARRSRSPAPRSPRPGGHCGTGGSRWPTGRRSRPGRSLTSCCDRLTPRSPTISASPPSWTCCASVERRRRRAGRCQVRDLRPSRPRPRAGPRARGRSPAPGDAMTPGTLRRLVVLRHAKSAWPETCPTERPLAPRGCRDAPAAGRWLREADCVPDLVVCSTARRTRQTWELAAAELGRRPRAVDPRGTPLRGERPGACSMSYGKSPRRFGR